MAVDITIHLNDTEQAKVSEWVDLIKPGLTNIEKRDLLEALARRWLRDGLISRVSVLRSETLSRQNASDREAISADDPLLPSLVPLQSAPVEPQGDFGVTDMPDNPSETA